MRKAWGLLAVCLVAGCGGEKEQAVSRRANKDPLVVTEDLKEPTVPVDPPKRVDPPSIDDIPRPSPADVVGRNGSAGTTNGGGILRSQPGTLSSVPDKPECLDEGAVLTFDPAKLRACFDSNEDGQADRCVTWRRDGKVASIDTMFDVEDADAPEPPEPPVEFRTDSENNDDERITLDLGTIDVCPFDRACMKLMPKVGDGEIQQVLTDPDYKRGAFVIRDSEGTKGTIELWDLTTGRMRTRIAMKRLVTDEAYDFSAHLGTGVIIAIADDSNSRALGSVFGLDGGFRGELAQGSRNLDIEKTFRHAGVFGIVDVGPVDEDKPYVLYLTSLASGGALGKFTIKRDDVASGIEFHTLPNSFVAVTQWGEQLRIDMIDLRSRTNRVLFAPSC